MTALSDSTYLFTLAHALYGLPTNGTARSTAIGCSRSRLTWRRHH